MTDSEVMPTNQRPIRQGGLMRCCLHTWQNSTMPSDVGTVLSCAYEDDPNNEKMIVAADGVWEWNRE